MLIEWIENGLKSPGKTKSGLADAIGRTPPVVSSILNGTRAVKARELPVIARYLGVEVPEEYLDSTGHPMPLIAPRTAVAGPVATGMWYAAGIPPLDETIPVVNTNYEAEDQIAYRVHDDAMDLSHIHKGFYVITTPYWKARRGYQINDVVVVEQVNGKGDKETSLKLVLEGAGDDIILSPNSSNEGWKSHVLTMPGGKKRVEGDPSIEVTRLVIMGFQFTARWE